MNTFSGYVKATSRPALFFLLLLLFFYVYEMVYKTAETSYLTFNKIDGTERLNSCPSSTSCLPQNSLLQVNYRRRLAFVLSEVKRLIARVAGKSAVVDAKWTLHLRALVEELRPDIAHHRTSSPYSANQPKIHLTAFGKLPNIHPTLPSNTSSSTTQPHKTKPHVCPEVYLTNKVNQSNTHYTIITEDCQYVPPFSTVLTAVLPATTWPPHTTNLVISNLRKLYQVPIIVIVNSTIVVQSNITNLTIFMPTNTSLSESDVLNQALKQVTTPYVFLASGLNHFSNQSSLERLVRVLDELPHVAVAAGAARDIHGHWQHGCLQHRMADYQATYTLGYYYSSHECMYCDDLLTPFVTSTALLHHLPLSSGLSGPVLYRHWLAQVRAAGHLAIMCPDVMFFVAQHVDMTPDDWQQLGHLLSLQTITSYTGEVHNFSCDDVGISCKGTLGIINSFLLPPCCRAFMERELGYIMDYGEQHHLHYELQSGSALSAVKMGWYVPWDYDHDLIFKSDDYQKWLNMRGPYLKERKCYLSMNIHYVYFTIYCPYFFLEMVCPPNWTSLHLLPPEFRHVPTTILYAGRWTSVPINPGLHVRNRMGIDILKHAAHWRTIKVSTVGKNKGGYDRPGTWNLCRNSTHHSCLDRYPGDGNLPIYHPFLHP